MAIAMSDVEDELARALALVLAAASEEGIDLDAPLPPLPISLDEVKLRRAGLELAIALHAALVSHRAELPLAVSAAAVSDARAAGATLTAKCARIAGYLAERDDDAWAADAVPNLLLMERLRAQLDDSLALIEATLGPGQLDALRAARRGLDRVLDPILQSIQPTERRVLAELVTRGAAPSPFSCVDIEPVRS
jgi:hypothetical protein